MNRVEEYLMPLVGQYVWGVDWDADLSLRMNFGAPYLEVLELPSRPGHRIVKPTGQWWLWVYFARWSISFDRVPAAEGGTLKCRSSLKRILRATARLDGQTVTAVAVKPTGTLSLAFDLGGRLKVRRLNAKKKKEDAWLLYQTKGDPILIVRSDGRFSYTGDSKKRRWSPISDSA